MKILNEMADFYEDIERGCDVWDDNFKPQFIDLDAAQVHFENDTLYMHVASWMNLAEHAALGVLGGYRSRTTGRGSWRRKHVCLQL
jgi:hypothetical protein